MNLLLGRMIDHCLGSNLLITACLVFAPACQVPVNGRERGHNCRRKWAFFLQKAGRGGAGRGKAGQGTRHISNEDEPIYGNEPTRNCKHKEIIKGANKEGNKGEQLGKINQ